jgi:hypothetical protein
MCEKWEWRMAARCRVVGGMDSTGQLLVGPLMHGSLSCCKAQDLGQGLAALRVLRGGGCHQGTDAHCTVATRRRRVCVATGHQSLSLIDMSGLQMTDMDASNGHVVVYCPECQAWKLGPMSGRTWSLTGPPVPFRRTGTVKSLPVDDDASF